MQELYLERKEKRNGKRKSSIHSRWSTNRLSKKLVKEGKTFLSIMKEVTDDGLLAAGIDYSEIKTKQNQPCWSICW